MLQKVRKINEKEEKKIRGTLAGYYEALLCVNVWLAFGRQP